MRAFVVALLLLLGLCGRAEAAWTRVQAGCVGNNTGSATSQNCVFGANLTAGNLVVCHATYGAGIANFSSFKISATTGTVASSYNDAGDNQSATDGYFINNPGGTGTVTLNLSPSTSSLQILCDEFTNTGVSTATADGHGGQSINAGTGTDAVKTGTTFGASGDLFYGATEGVHTCGGTTTLTVGTGFTAATSNNNDTGFFNCAEMTEWKVGSGASDVTFTSNTASEVYLVGGMAFTAGGGGATCPQTLALMGVGC